MSGLMIRLLRREYRSRPMARFTLWILAYGVVLELADVFGRTSPAFLWFIFWICLTVAGLYYLVRVIRLFRQRMLWQVRWRLVITYLFIAVVPVLLIVFLVGLAAVIINGQFAAYLAGVKLRNHFDELRQINRIVSHEAHFAAEPTPSALLDHLKSFYLTELGDHARSYPDLEITLRIGSAVRAFKFDGSSIPNPAKAPPWLHQEEFAGIVMDGNQIALRSVDRRPTGAGDLTIILSQPFTPRLLDLVGEGIGPVGVLVPMLRIGSKTVSSRALIQSDAVQLPQKSNIFDAQVFGVATLDPVLWNASPEQRLSGSVPLFANSRIFALNRELISTLGQFSRVYLVVFMILAVIFLALEVFALVVGVRLTRTITTTVDRLQYATERVKGGDFSYRISLPARDQLSALGQAFDTMTASVERLLREVEEKTRLQGEVEIAREVQRQLFPQTTPEIPGFELHAVCNPARGVSGDYYDFLKIGPTSVGVILGDVSGKGISAALLMASLQAALRAHYYDKARRDNVAAAMSTAATVAQLNRQLVENTPAEKYATVFYAVYNAATRKLTYTNAGHPAPFLLRAQGVERLRAGGTPVGLFEAAEYEENEVQIEPGDLLLAFSDGVTEPENSYGEEFGEAQVLEVIRRAGNIPLPALVEEIIRSVNDWTGSPELQDDMTIIAARACKRSAPSQASRIVRSQPVESARRIATT